MHQAKTPEPIFPRLSGGRGGIGADRTSRHQRGRLEGAMVEAVARHGYPETTIGELVGLAGVSKTTFYDHFESKEQCFLATFETIVAEARLMVEAAYREERSLRGKVGAAMTRFAEIVAAETPAATLVVVDSLSLGAAALAHRERAAEAFELMLKQSFESAGGPRPSEFTVRAIVAGIRRVVYRCLRKGCPEELRDQVEELLDWALSYQRQAAGPPHPPLELAGATGVPPTGREIGWEEPPGSRRARAALTQRQRIVRATAQVAAEDGYQVLSIPAISARAGTSNQTFYEHFESKEEPFLAAFEELAQRAQRATTAAAASQREWQASVEAGIRGLLEHIAAERLFARLAFVELPVAGVTGLDRADATTRRFTAFLEPQALPAGLRKLPPVVIEAIGGGMWGAIQHEVGSSGTLARPAELAPELAALVLAPLRPD